MTTTHIPAFLHACVVIDESASDGLDITALYGRYLSWALTEALTPTSITDFSTAIRHHGVRHDDDQGPLRYYPGAQIIDPPVGA
ncbi:hypothetical protein LRQ04_16405 [Paenarthrobacter sp. AR 02]|uniref:hypothetical protein n=1 Tax=Paenarthrobacter sp. AR 02 TaxID=2899821 RepID=UPI001F425A4E|nr:hypothetical protein [Paenarthrobacter sp. AR 02]MCF3140839.1 hypothetical protein [Paenarthrobacter sp. AR 02]